MTYRLLALVAHNTSQRLEGDILTHVTTQKSVLLTDQTNFLQHNEFARFQRIHIRRPAHFVSLRTHPTHVAMQRVARWVWTRLASMNSNHARALYVSTSRAAKWICFVSMQLVDTLIVNTLRLVAPNDLMNDECALSAKESTQYMSPRWFGRHNVLCAQSARYVLFIIITDLLELRTVWCFFCHIAALAPGWQYELRTQTCCADTQRKNTHKMLTHYTPTHKENTYAHVKIHMYTRHTRNTWSDLTNTTFSLTHTHIVDCSCRVNCVLSCAGWYMCVSVGDCEYICVYLCVCACVC